MEERRQAMTFDRIRVNRSRTCRCCGRARHRVLVVCPKDGDRDYCVALCPDCDMTTGRAGCQL